MIERTIQLWPWACVLVAIGVLLLLGPLSALAADESPVEGGARNELLQLEREALVKLAEDDGLIDRQVFVHLAVRVGGRWALRSSYTAPEPG